MTWTLDLNFFGTLNQYCHVLNSLRLHTSVYIFPICYRLYWVPQSVNESFLFFHYQWVAEHLNHSPRFWYEGSGRGQGRRGLWPAVGGVYTVNSARSCCICMMFAWLPHDYAFEVVLWNPCANCLQTSRGCSVRQMCMWKCLNTKTTNWALSIRNGACWSFKPVETCCICWILWLYSLENDDCYNDSIKVFLRLLNASADSFWTLWACEYGSLELRP